ncbi:hypothetical protein L7F22_053067 [Adiantum nelumboides]|nr:hypothetical protein [Adiantum nelumboides]
MTETGEIRKSKDTGKSSGKKKSKPRQKITIKDFALENVNEGLAKLQSLGGQLNVDKCHIAEKQATLLGHVVSSSAIEADPGEVKDLSLPADDSGIKAPSSAQREVQPPLASSLEIRERGGELNDEGARFPHDLASAISVCSLCRSRLGRRRRMNAKRVLIPPLLRQLRFLSSNRLNSARARDQHQPSSQQTLFSGALDGQMDMLRRMHTVHVSHFKLSDGAPSSSCSGVTRGSPLQEKNMQLNDKGEFQMAFQTLAVGTKENKEAIDCLSELKELFEVTIRYFQNMPAALKELHKEDPNVMLVTGKQNSIFEAYWNTGIAKVSSGTFMVQLEEHVLTFMDA